MAETETLAAPAATAKPEATQEKPIKRQMVGFTFFKVMPEWRRLPAAERAEHKRRFAEVHQTLEQARTPALAHLLHRRPPSAIAIWCSGASAIPPTTSTR